MSFFYLTPVKGDVPVYLMENLLVKRLEYLQALVDEKRAEYNEYLIEGSLYDNVGHFILCVMGILSENREFSQFIYKSEIMLFNKRILSLSAYDIRCFAKKLLRSIRKCEKTPSFLYPLIILCQHFLVKNLAQHVCSQHEIGCINFNIEVSFKHCLSFVSKRQVELSNGMALIPCGKWKQYLVNLYGHNLKQRLQYTDLSALKGDPRIMELLNKIKRQFFPSLNPMRDTSNYLHSSNVDRVSKYFPPCMLNLHLNLRKRHRLSHNQRFYYSLFLKDVGMPIDQAVSFWQSEYRQDPNGQHNCCHNWEKDEKKYLYGIRHMYGLEGARKNYTSVNCKCIQGTDNAISEGGCPFKSFDELKLKNLINTTTDTWSQIMDLKSKHKYTECCLLYLKTNENNICDNFSFNFTPVKYYNIVTKCMVDKLHIHK